MGAEINVSSGLSLRQGAGEAVSTGRTGGDSHLRARLHTRPLITSHCQGAQFSRMGRLMLPMDLAEGQEEAVGRKSIGSGTRKIKSECRSRSQGERDCVCNTSSGLRVCV